MDKNFLAITIKYLVGRAVPSVSLSTVLSCVVVDVAVSFLLFLSLFLGFSFSLSLICVFWQQTSNMGHFQCSLHCQPTKDCNCTQKTGLCVLFIIS